MTFADKRKDVIQVSQGKSDFAVVAGSHNVAAAVHTFSPSRSIYRDFRSNCLAAIPTLSHVKKDTARGWGLAPRIVFRAETILNGSSDTCAGHEVIWASWTWVSRFLNVPPCCACAGQLLIIVARQQQSSSRLQKHSGCCVFGLAEPTCYLRSLRLLSESFLAHRWYDRKCTCVLQAACLRVLLLPLCAGLHHDFVGLVRVFHHNLKGEISAC